MQKCIDQTDTNSGIDQNIQEVPSARIAGAVVCTQIGDENVRKVNEYLAKYLLRHIEYPDTPWSPRVLMVAFPHQAENNKYAHEALNNEGRGAQ